MANPIHLNVPNVIISACQHEKDSLSSDCSDQLEVISISGSSLSNFSNLGASKELEDVLSIKSSLSISSCQTDSVSIYSHALSTKCEDFISKVIPDDVGSVSSAKNNSKVFTVRSNGHVINAMHVENMTPSDPSKAGLKFGVLIFLLLTIIVVVVIMFV